MASQDERDIRDAAATFFRQEAPGCRVIHELNVGWCRADLAVVELERVTLVEIKSKRDKLDRLAAQVRAFKDAAHHTIIIADIRWFREARAGHVIPTDQLRDGVGNGCEIWQWPRVDDHTNWHRWKMPKMTIAQPHAAKLLSLLWKDELLTEARAHGLPVKSRWPMDDIIRAMAYHLTGAQIARAACRQLRCRPFAEADPPLTPAYPLIQGEIR